MKVKNRIYPLITRRISKMDAEKELEKEKKIIKKNESDYLNYKRLNHGHFQTQKNLLHIISIRMSI